jgi:hypothetical protein
MIIFLRSLLLFLFPGSKKKGWISPVKEKGANSLRSPSFVPVNGEEQSQTPSAWVKKWEISL